MASIRLNGRRANGRCAIVDDCDTEWMSGYNWHLAKIGYVYGRPKGGGEKILMHRLVMGARKGQLIDHINGNRLDNRRENLRFCTESQNKANRFLQKNNQSGYKGVSYDKRSGTWEWSVKRGATRLRGRGLLSPDAAASAYDEAAKMLYGDFAVLNFSDGGNNKPAFEIPPNLF